MQGFPLAGLVLRTHPDDGPASFRVMLDRADAIVMNDGEIVYNWPRIIADSSTVGLNGRDAGELVGDVWYEVHAVRRRADNARGLILHRRKSYVRDQQQPQGLSVLSLRDNAVRQKLAQEITPQLAGSLEILDIPIRRFGAPSGRIWMEVETSAGVAVSDKILVDKLATAITAFNLRFIFRDPLVVGPSFPFRATLEADFPVNPSNCVQWYTDASDSYSGGDGLFFDGSAWHALAKDFAFKAYVTQNDLPLAMPEGFDQSALIGFFYTNRFAPHRFDPMVFHGRHAQWGIRSTGKYPTDPTMDLEDFTNTMAIVKDSNIAFPHGLPVLVDIEVSKSSPGFVIVAGICGGHACTADDFDNAVTGEIEHAGDSVAAGQIFTEYGGLYALTDSGVATVLTPGWRW